MVINAPSTSNNYVSNDYSYSGSDSSYETDYPEFAGLSFAEKSVLWNKKYSADFDIYTTQLEAQLQDVETQRRGAHLLHFGKFMAMMWGMGGNYNLPPRYTAPRPQLQPSSATSIKVTFGQNPYQIHHTFRHIERAGLNRTDVMNAVRSSLKNQTIKPGVPNNISIKINNQEIIYSAYQLENGLINVGRIVIPK